ncbi:calmodulin-binding transcription activator 2 isoform X23 [Monodelphis domestica]|uniref:calmodulin-binding transcription activator 2 isoform X23 n=1 Tax=Monodelphis domestica TaxID=13616 RepID=UPI0024E276D1|nr:calmodulin-binding transcription activator 2 isoform X23 [Monodelphis domestica]
MNNKDTTEVAENSHHLKIFLPKKLLECLPRCPLLPPERLRWNTNEEIASYLITFEKHDEWLSCSPKTRPQNGSIILYNRKKVKYRKDGYCWKKRKDGKTTREDHMKLKVQGMEGLKRKGTGPQPSFSNYLLAVSLWLLCSLLHCSHIPSSMLLAATGSTGSLPHKCSNTKHRIISPKIEPRTLAIPPAPPPRPPEPLPRVAPLRTEPPEPPKVDTSPSSSSSSSSGFAEPPEISSRHPVAPGGLPRAAPALLLLTGLEQLTGGLTPSRHLAPQPEFGPSLGLALVLGPQPPAPPCPPSPAFDPDRFFNNPSQGQTYGGGLGVSPNFPEAEAARTPCPALEPAAALEPVASDQGTTSKPGERREGNRFFIQDDASGEGTGPATVSSSPSMEPAARPGRGEGLFGAPGGTSELETFSLSSFPDLMGDLISEEAPGAPGPPALSVITDFSPEWSYPEGGVKVLITGPWTEVSERYSCVFDHILVPASLVQSGVLRCYCPAHEAGLVSLQVAGEEGPLSASVLFEYRARRFLALPSTQLDWLSLDDNQFRMSILERLEQMENRMAEIAAAGQVPPPGSDQSPVQGGVPGPGFEARVVVLVERMIPRYGWRGPDHLVHGGPFRGMSLLHLAAAQGYARLIETLSQWRTMEAESLDLEQEVDPLNVDHFSCTPLMWACALGHLEAAVLLFRWNHQALHIPDSLGRLPLTVAHSRGHVQLARCLEELQRQEASVKPLPTPSPSSASPDTGLSSVSSPSELSDGTFSVTSAYSNAPDSSPPSAPLPISEGAVEVTQSSQSSHGLPELPSVFMDYKDSSPKGLPLPPSPHSTVETPIQGYGASSKGIDCHQAVDVLQVDMISLAKQIVEATPERIKQEDFGSVPMAGGSLQEQVGAMGLNETMSWLASYLENVDHLPNLPQHRKLPLEQGHLAVPPAPSWAEFLGASANGKMESDFALLTLSDHEQRELYEAGRVIQTPFRKYKGRRLKEQQEMAAAVIQRCYRKYKQFALYKKMTQAAILIQSKFRSYYEQKRFQQSRRAAVLIQQHYRSYRCRPGPCHRPSGPSGPLPPRSKGSFLTKKQDQAARKIMRFLRRCQHRMKELKQNQELESLPQPELAT